MADGLSYYDGSTSVCSVIRVVGVVYVVVGNRAVGSIRAMRLTDEQYIYILLEKSLTSSMCG
jgi:hypothetical protein